MVKSLFSPSWYRVAGLKPRLRRHAHIHRHHYRGELWYVLQDLGQAVAGCGDGLVMGGARWISL
jgi:hypothetical protein